MQGFFFFFFNVCERACSSYRFRTMSHVCTSQHVFRCLEWRHTVSKAKRAGRRVNSHQKKRQFVEYRHDVWTLRPHQVVLRTWPRRSSRRPPLIQPRCGSQVWANQSVTSIGATDRSTDCYLPQGPQSYQLYIQHRGVRTRSLRQESSG